MFHDQVGRPAVDPIVEDLYDVGAPELSCRFGLALEARARQRCRALVVAHELHGYGGVERDMPRDPYGSHPTPSEGALKRILLPDDGAGLQFHRVRQPGNTA